MYEAVPENNTRIEDVFNSYAIKVLMPDVSASAFSSGCLSAGNIHLVVVFNIFPISSGSKFCDTYSFSNTSHFSHFAPFRLP